MTTTAMAEPMIAWRWRRLWAAAARSAISFSSRARAAARCRSLIDDTVFLLLFSAWGDSRLGARRRGCGRRRPRRATVKLVMVIFFGGLTLSPASLATVGILPILATVSMPPVTLPTIGYFGVAGVKSLKKIRNWLPLVPGGLPISATVPLG